MINLSNILKTGLLVFQKIFQFNTDKHLHQQAQLLYALAVEQLRTPLFYEQYEIPDDPRGRFEMLSLHLFILLRILKENIKGAPSSTNNQLCQKICDLFVADMDHSLRNLALTDLKIDRNFKKFIESFYGRLVAYDVAYEQLCENYEEARTNLVESLLKNIYNNDKAKEICAQWFADYVIAQLSFMKFLPLDKLCFKKDLWDGII